MLWSGDQQQNVLGNGASLREGNLNNADLGSVDLSGTDLPDVKGLTIWRPLRGIVVPDHGTALRSSPAVRASGRRPHVRSSWPAGQTVGQPRSAAPPQSMSGRRSDSRAWMACDALNGTIVTTTYGNCYSILDIFSPGAGAMGWDKARKPRKPRGEQGFPRILNMGNVSVETKKNAVLSCIMHGAGAEVGPLHAQRAGPPRSALAGAARSAQ